MDITITFHDGRWKTDPNPAIVAVGTRVRWIIRAPRSQFSKLRWIVKFGINTPFTNRPEFIVETRNTGVGSRGGEFPRELRHLFEELGVTEEIVLDHRGGTEPAAAEDPGDYKYDLRVEDAETGELVGEEDPVLFVLRGPFRVWF